MRVPIAFRLTSSQRVPLQAHFVCKKARVVTAVCKVLSAVIDFSELAMRMAIDTSWRKWQVLLEKMNT